MLWAPDRDGVAANVVRGFDNLADYAHAQPALRRDRRPLREPHRAGRARHRRAGARALAQRRQQLPARRHATASASGCGRSRPRASTTRRSAARPSRCATSSADGEEGFPGRVEALVTYSLGGDLTWRVDYEATTDRPTVVNLSHHDYFNLAGRGSALDHVLTLPASRFNPVDANLIPTGIADVDGTPFDFRAPTRIRARLGDAHAQLALAGGYDHNWILDAAATGTLRLAATLADPASGRAMTLHTTEPAMQFYSGNFLDGTLTGHDAETYQRGDAICLEPQHSPDSPHHADWPSTVLRPGEVYRSCTVYRFTAFYSWNSVKPRPMLFCRWL